MQSVIRAAVFAAAVVSAAWAQPVPPPSSAADAQPAYRSVFDDYRRWTDATTQDWRRLNAEMQRLGGHAGHLRAGPPADGKPPSQADTAGKSNVPREKSR